MKMIKQTSGFLLALALLPGVAGAYGPGVYWPSVPYYMPQLMQMMQMMQHNMESRQGGSFGVNTRNWSDTSAYYLDIQYSGMEPQDIEIMPVPGGIVVRNTRQKMAQQQQPGGGMQWFSMGQNFQNAHAMPADADIRRMQRLDQPGMIRVVVPKMPR